MVRKWKENDFQINGRDLWSKEYWINIDKLIKLIKIYVTHISAHAKDNSHTTLGNQIADKLAKGIEVDEEITITNRSKTYRLKLKLERNPQTGQYQTPQIPKLKLKREGNIFTKVEDEPLQFTPEFVKKTHEQLGHPGQTAMINWFTQRNLAAKIEDIKKGINECNACKNM